MKKIVLIILIIFALFFIGVKYGPAPRSSKTKHTTASVGRNTSPKAKKDTNKTTMGDSNKTGMQKNNSKESPPSNKKKNKTSKNDPETQNRTEKVEDSTGQLRSLLLAILLLNLIIAVMVLIAIIRFRSQSQPEVRQWEDRRTPVHPYGSEYKNLKKIIEDLKNTVTLKVQDIQESINKLQSENVNEGFYLNQQKIEQIVEQKLNSVKFEIPGDIYEKLNALDKSLKLLLQKVENISSPGTAKSSSGGTGVASPRHYEPGSYGGTQKIPTTFGRITLDQILRQYRNYLENWDRVDLKEKFNIKNRINQTENFELIDPLLMGKKITDFPGKFDLVRQYGISGTKIKKPAIVSKQTGEVVYKGLALIPM